MRIVQHPNGVWRDRADFILFLDGPQSEVREEVWARHLDANRYELCCIPFFAHDYALGDIVRVENFVIQEILEGSGRWSFRIAFERPQRATEILGELEKGGCLFEGHGALIAIDAPDRRVRDWTVERLKQYDWEGALHLE